MRGDLPLSPGRRWYRTRRRLRTLPVWRLPLGLLAGGVLLAWLLPLLDRELAKWEYDVGEAVFPEVDGGAMSNLLSAVAGGMITLTGLVFTALTLAMQFGSSQLSVRVVPILRQDPVMRWSVGVFLATFVYTLLVSVRLAVREEDYRPVLSMLFAIGLALICAVLFLALVTRVTGVLNSGYLLRVLAAEGRLAVADVHPEPDEGARAKAPGDGAVAAVAGDARPVAVRLGRPPRTGQVLLAFDAQRLEALARASGSRIELLPVTGDFIALEAPLLHVYGPEAGPESGPEAEAEAGVDRAELLACLLFGETHSARTDPAGALRSLVDIALKALSPAVNDPGRAVQALDHIEDLLVMLAPRLTGGPPGRAGAAFVFRTRSWADYVCIGTDEIRHFGATSMQVQRRLRALYATVALVCAPDQVAPITARVEAMDAEAAAQWPQPLDRELARRPDPQGLGTEGGSGA